MSDRHMPITTETLEHLDFLNTHITELTQWEQDLVRDRATAVREFGDAAVLTGKQIESLKRTFHKVRLKVSGVSK